MVLNDPISNKDIDIIARNMISRERSIDDNRKLIANNITWADLFFAATDTYFFALENYEKITTTDIMQRNRWEQYIKDLSQCRSRILNKDPAWKNISKEAIYLVLNRIEVLALKNAQIKEVK